MAQYKSGFVAVIGRPNVGKSTLLNSLLQQKIAIVSDKPQTTRNMIQAVLSRPEGQIVFLDTPGIHDPQHKLGEYMMKSARAALEEVDAVCLVVDITKWRAGDEAIITGLKNLENVFLIANKMDLVTDEKREQFCANIQANYKFADIIPISAKSGDNLELLVNKLMACLPEGPQYYPDDWVTDHPERFVIAEFIREQILINTEAEIPHSVAVDIDEIKSDDKKDLIRIRATIYVERDSQKGIIIGKQGRMLKKIGSDARIHIEALFGSQIFLDLWVKVKKDWRNKAGSLREFGYH